MRFKSIYTHCGSTNVASKWLSKFLRKTLNAYTTSLTVSASVPITSVALIPCPPTEYTHIQPPPRRLPYCMCVLSHFTIYRSSYIAYIVRILCLKYVFIIYTVGRNRILISSMIRCIYTQNRAYRDDILRVRDTWT